jgi:hypothetical protein
VLAQLQKAIWITLFLALVSGFGVAVWKSEKARRDHNSQHQTQPTITKDQDSPAGGSIANAVTNKDSGKGQKEGNWYDTFSEHPAEWLIAIFNGLLVYVTYRLVSTTGDLRQSTDRLWRASKQQMRLMERIDRRQSGQTIASLAIAARNATAAQNAATAAKASADAFMTAEKAHLITEIKASTVAKILEDNIVYVGSPDKFENEVDSPSLGYHFINIGRTPAIIKELSNHLVFKPFSPDPDLTWYSIREQGIERPVVLPGKESSIFACLMLDTMTLGKCVEFQKRKAGFWFYGYVIFDDVFGREHQWRWRFAYRRGYDDWRLEYFREFPGPGGQAEIQ